ncbi:MULTISPECIES: DUF6538 domain-containing protein [Rhodopseudomonas]|uniref:DUF6538 domain-containing protein n=1 Tax=Rhodopseudomonas palustris TaxID=1076 RepID=A0A0D7E300_RHOPL|nr:MULTISPECIES: DUF6538 domain-containing protein [Rhodopseudomonas]KIZ34835.1 hypothetical protein OO17_26350 [Rhodopseudomonas palustris]MDF3810698.1 tyrosine-type recombinase/integrase [Rhodopseudomonas sp. BAL398]WOK18488.1 tyrosine-type recombinase/integrase [Rhodopseudomonas sp. BAL398]
MAAKIPHLLTRNGRHYARIVIPTALRSLFADKWELTAPLGADRREARRRLSAAVADMQVQIDAARQQVRTTFKPKVQPKPGKPLTVRQMAGAHYASELAEDDHERAMHGSADEPPADMSNFGPAYEARLRKIAGGKVGNDEIAAGVGWIIDSMRQDGYTDVKTGTAEWRERARDLAGIQLEVIKRNKERDDGDFNGTPTHPLLIPAKPLASDPLLVRMLDADSAKSLGEVFPEYCKERSAMPATNKECEVAIRMFEEFLEDKKPLYRIVRADLLGLKRALADTPSNYTKRFPGMTLPQAIAANKKRKTPFSPLTARTINNKYLSRIHSILNWCARGDLIPDNPAVGVKVDSIKPSNSKRKYFSSDNLRQIFPVEMFRRPMGEFEWAMLISLYGGMRASELAQMQLASIRSERDVLIFNIEEQTKNAGSKRMVPVHRKLLNHGLLKYVHALKLAGETHLFPDWYRKGMEAKQRASENGHGDSLNHYFPRFIPKRFNETYLPQVGVTDGSTYWHTFRHTFKTGLSLGGVVKSTRDYLCGHADSSAGAVYVHDISIAAMAEAIERLSFDGLTLPQ